MLAIVVDRVVANGTERRAWWWRRRPALATALAATIAATAGCSRPSDPDPVTQKKSALTVPVPPVTDFAIFASRNASFDDRTVVASGSVGVAAGATNTLTAGTDTHISEGRVLLSPVVVLRDRANTGEIGTNSFNPGAGDVTGPVSAYLAPPPQPTPGTITPGATPVNVNLNQTLTLAPGAYGAVSINNNGQLNLSGGLYQFQSLQVNVGSRVIAQASTTVRVATTVTGLDSSRFLATGSASGLRLIVGGTTSAVTLGNDVQMSALVVALGDVRAGDRFIFSGAIAGRDVIIGHDCRINFAAGTGFQCANNANCNDNNTCTTDVCGDAICTHTALANGTTCNDGNACTRTDRCNSNAVCVGSNPVVCTALDQCHVAGVCAPATGVCSNPNKPDGTTCNDSNACTLADTCQAGTCAGGNPVVCTALDQCHDAGACNPATGVCANPNKTNGTTCDDGDKCTKSDVCTAGVCAGTNNNDCGCFLGDTDGDKVNDCTDGCPRDPLKTSPGICGCGVADTDRDLDGVPDCQDGCPDDFTAQYRGICGCPSSPTVAGTPCGDGICRGPSVCDGAGKCGGSSTTQCQPQPGAGCVAKVFQKKVYWFCPGPVSWDGAVAACKTIGTPLVQIDSLAEDLFVAKNLLGGATAWTGANDRSLLGNWRWENAASPDGDLFWTGGAAGAPYFAAFNSWTGGTPTDAGRCGSIAVGSLWQSSDCTMNAAFVCEGSLSRTDGPFTNPHDFCEVLHIPCTTTLPPISQCTGTIAGTFGTMDKDAVITAGEDCDTACAHSNPDNPDQACLDACKAPFDIPPGTSTCPPFGDQAVKSCVVQPPDPNTIFPCSFDAECAGLPGTMCGVIIGCPSAPGGPCPPSSTGTSLYCGKPVAGCPLNNDTDFPDRCGEIFLCDGTKTQDTPGFGNDSNLTHDTITQDSFPAADPTPPVTEPYPVLDTPCSGNCTFAPDGPNHPWCVLGVQDHLLPRDAEQPAKSGKTHGDVVSFDFEPKLRLDHTLEVGPFGNPSINLGAEAGVTASVDLGEPLISSFHVPLLNADAQLHATECSLSGSTVLTVLNVDFLPFLTGDATFGLPVSFPSAASQANCQAAYRDLKNAGDRAKKALRDAVELRKQYKALHDAGRNFIQPGLCNDTGAISPPRGFPTGNCSNGSASELPEATINRFIEYYKRTVVGFKGANSARGLQEVIGAIGNPLTGPTFHITTGFQIYSFTKDEEQTIFETILPIGPIPVNLELLATLHYGATISANLDFNPGGVIAAMETGSGADSAQRIAYVEVSGGPFAGAGLGLFAGVGFGVNSFKAKIGIEGDIQLGEIAVPAYAGAGISLGSEIDPRPAPADMAEFVTGTNLITPKRYVVSVDYKAGLKATVRNILSGTVDGVLKLKIAFFSKKWRARLFSFTGFCAGDPSIPNAACDLTLISGSGNTEAAEGAYPWGTIRTETPFPELQPIQFAAGVGTDHVNLGQVQQFFYDSLCTCINGADTTETRHCFRSEDCCPNLPVCFPDPGTGVTSCISCRAANQTCNKDSDCCGPNVCSTVTGTCTLGGCLDQCKRPEECGPLLQCGTDGLCFGGGCVR